MIDQDRRRIGVYGLAVVDRAVLLVRIAPGHPDAGLWTLPGGGLEWGETPRRCLEREIGEETGMSVTAAYPLDVSSEIVPEPADDPIHALFMVYRVVVAGVPRAEGAGSTDAAEWHRLSAMPGTVPLVSRSLEAASVQSTP